MNAGIPLADPTGGYFFVFMTGRPAFRKYDAAGSLLFERLIQGVELDALLEVQPTEWPRRAVRDREVPFAAGTISPTSLSFTRQGRVLVTPGCYEFDPATRVE